MKSENEIFNPEVLKSQFRDVQELTKDNKVVCKAVFSQITDSNEPYRIGDVAFIYANDVEVAKISFSMDQDEAKSKSVEIDVTDMLTEKINGIKFKTLLDNSAVSNAKDKSEAEFSIRIKGKKMVDEKFKTKLPFRVVEDIWVLTQIG